MSRSACAIAAAMVAVAGASVPVMAQEATHTPAATQPAAGRLYMRQKVQYVSLGDDPSPEARDITKVVSTTTLTYGLRRDTSLSLEVPMAYAAEVAHGRHATRRFGVNDISLSIKHRPWQLDLNPVDSLRLAVVGGVEVPSGDGDFSSHSFDPFVGAVFTAILGRHGVNQSIVYKFNTGGDAFNTRAGDGPDDAVRFDTSYLFRLSPVEYSAASEAATYVTLEANGLYETNGDVEVIAGPGILYEARTFALEATIGLPMVQEVRERPEVDLVVTLGLRILF